MIDRDEAALQILAAAIAGLAAKVNAPSFDLQDEASVDAFGRWVIDVLRRVNERMLAPSGEATERLNWLEAAGKEPSRRCVQVQYQPKIGLMETDRWSIHLNGIGWIASKPTLAEAIDEAKTRSERWQEMLAFRTPAKAAAAPSVLQGEPRL